MLENSNIDRLKMRGRPPGAPIMHQVWENTLFMHWPVDPAALSPLLPPQLEIDTFEGKAWVGITPFHVEDMRPTGMPVVPWLSSFHELNVRTYVTHQGVPGIWFFSLDVSKALPALAARTIFLLPYFKARMRFDHSKRHFRLEVHRKGPPDAEFTAKWRTGARLRDPDLHSLAFFLVERYCAFAVESGKTFEIRIQHHPWILDQAFVEMSPSTLMLAAGLPEPSGDPLLHYSGSLEVEIWAPVEAGAKQGGEVKTELTESGAQPSTQSGRHG